MSEPQDLVERPPWEGREGLSILVGVVVSLVYVAAIAVVVIGVLRFVREYVRRPATPETPARAILARLPFRR